MIVKTLFSNRGVTNAVAVRLISPTCFYRGASTEVAMSPSERKLHLQELLKEELPKPYEGPERDHVNFPRLKRPEVADKVRMGFLPDDWYQFFYKKTGVTGPYLFGTGLITFLVSKEWYVIEEEFSTGLALAIMSYIAIKKYGPTLRNYLRKECDKDIAELYDKKNKHMDELREAIDASKKNVWQYEGQKILMNAKRENVHMQLETEYRRRMMQVYEQVKKRLDFQLDYNNTKRKLEQKHMVDWIVSSVVKSISPQQEKEALQKCIDDLKSISARA